MTSAQARGGLLDEVGDFAEHSAAAGLPAHRLQKTARSVLDTIGNMVLGSTQPLYQAIALATRHWGQGECASVIGEQRLAPAGTAAFVNGTLAHCMDFDDSHLPSVLHPSAAVVPAVLAIGEATEATGPQSLTAIAVGTELCIRLGMAGYDAENANSIFFDRGQHATSICGTVGAAVAAAMLLAGDSRSIAAAASIAASMGSGIIECNRTGGTVKPVHTGWAAHSGIAAAQLAASGITGPPTALEGRFGLFRAFCGTRARPAVVTADLGRHWHSDALHIKPYPCNHFTHAGIDAAVELRKRGVRADEIIALRLGLPEPVLRAIAEPAAAKAAPASGYAGAFSGPYTVAAAMHGGGGLALYTDDFTDAAVRRPEVLRLAAKVTCYADPECTSAFPLQLPARLTAHLAGGRIEEAACFTNRGGPRRPLTDEELYLKFSLNLSPALDDASAQRLRNEIFLLTGQASPQSVMRLLRKLNLYRAAPSRGEGNRSENKTTRTEDYGGPMNGTAADQRWEILNPAIHPTDPHQYLRAAVEWHFGEATGSAFWLKRAKTLDFDPLATIHSYDDLRRFPNFADDLRDVPVQDLIPRGYGPHPPAPRVFESGGTTGAPKRIILMPDWLQSALDRQEKGPQFAGRQPSNILVAAPTGPHKAGGLYDDLSARQNVIKFSIDIDPRWVKKLISRGETEQVQAYIEHVLDQIEHVLTSQEIGMMVTTPPLLLACARRPRLVELINAKVELITWGGAHMSLDQRFELEHMHFPKPRFLSRYSSALILEGARQRPGTSPDEEIIYDPRSPVVTFLVVDAETGEHVEYGQRGQVIMNHVSKGMFLPNNLERDTAIRVPGLPGQIGDSVSAPEPVETFGGEAVIEGIY